MASLTRAVGMGQVSHHSCSVLYTVYCTVYCTVLYTVLCCTVQVSHPSWDPELGLHNLYMGAADAGTRATIRHMADRMRILNFTKPYKTKEERNLV